MLCAEATIHEDKCGGDPDEGALVVLAAKHGIGAEATPHPLGSLEDVFRDGLAA